MSLSLLYVAASRSCTSNKRKAIGQQEIRLWRQGLVSMKPFALCENVLKTVSLKFKFILDLIFIKIAISSIKSPNSIDREFCRDMN